MASPKPMCVLHRIISNHAKRRFALFATLTAVFSLAAAHASQAYWLQKRLELDFQRNYEQMPAQQTRLKKLMEKRDELRRTYESINHFHLLKNEQIAIEAKIMAGDFGQKWTLEPTGETTPEVHGMPELHGILISESYANLVSEGHRQFFEKASDGLQDRLMKCLLHQSELKASYGEAFEFKKYLKLQRRINRLVLTIAQAAHPNEEDRQKNFSFLRECQQLLSRPIWFNLPR